MLHLILNITLLVKLSMSSLSHADSALPQYGVDLASGDTPLDSISVELPAKSNLSMKVFDLFEMNVITV